MDYNTLLYDPNYAILGVTARLALVTGFGKDITVIDKTSGVAVSDSGSVDVGTVRPGATVRMSELSEKNIRVADLENASLELNERVWQVKACLPRPAPDGGIASGEILMILMEANDGR